MFDQSSGLGELPAGLGPLALLLVSECQVEVSIEPLVLRAVIVLDFGQGFLEDWNRVFGGFTSLVLHELEPAQIGQKGSYVARTAGLGMTVCQQLVKQRGGVLRATDAL